MTVDLVAMDCYVSIDIGGIDRKSPNNQGGSQENSFADGFGPAKMSASSKFVQSRLKSSLNTKARQSFTFSQLFGPSPQLFPPPFVHWRLVYCSGN
ncbi:hypothetical protein BCCR75502_01064 [Burkholderia sola]|nr:hypothetical protein BCCR75389_01051 [Burkholderia cenocepacia]CAG2264893.1 hypothetical protein BCCR75386_01065 [Burkholderia cenocepacia]CAG2265020.1 hypothetical protein BCCR75388_01066 [Burkholderia cenocepacia]CAG2265079.1 hypothetical protein BCCR75384_01066 [Burkholderia cenocepacia]CAG2265101.1 hypothetical protein BCCR75387_01066 [Burkholderia cenocepacia]